ncbi:MAG: tRNA (adenine-N1)-methyltransferase [Actinomycetaceae bacterium]|nr:tRNA (adenine-N1)-methyltransferase [Actinomycetaceae bacterium]
MNFEYRAPRSIGAEFGQATRTGPLRSGDFVQITDPKGKLHTVVLTPGEIFQCARGRIRHDDLIGQPAAITVEDGGRHFQILRPRLADYVMSMPRGAAIIYPKDAGQIVAFGDIFPGARVLEAGVGSGGLTLFLLSAIGTGGELVSVDQRADFATIAQGNVDLWFGGRHPAWTVKVGNFNDVAYARKTESIDRVVLDMLAPWECLAAAEHVLVPGGIVLIYVATVTQLSRVREEIVRSGRFTPPEAWESSIRPWHLDGLAVRPTHRMVAHTGFLLMARKMASHSQPHQRASRPARAAEGKGGQWDGESGWSEHRELNPPVSGKKIRRSARGVISRAETLLDQHEQLSLEWKAQEEHSDN